MAKGMKPDDATKQGVKASDLRKVVKSINDLKDAASEHAGLAGKETQNACELHGLEKTSLTFTARLARMEDAKRGAVVRTMIEYWEKMGFFDAIDAFDDVVGVMEGVCKRARAKESRGAAPDPAVADLAGATVN